MTKIAPRLFGGRDRNCAGPRMKTSNPLANNPNNYDCERGKYCFLS